MVRSIFLILLAGASIPARGQMNMPGMSGMNMTDMNPAGMDLMNLASGTSVNPDSWPMPMIVTHFGSWNTMFMGDGFLVDTQQSGPRGGDKVYSTNWVMASAEHRAGKSGAFQIGSDAEPGAGYHHRSPLSIAVPDRRNGIRQSHRRWTASAQFHHGPRASTMCVSSGGHTRLEFYAAPVGDPALGPVAYPHRASAAELPEAPISHHWQDSTHISDDVVTVGLAYRQLKLEASGFHGAEPGENRWIIQQGAIDSWSSRLWFFPAKNWAAQVSVGRLAHPEALEPGDQVRSTASLEYTKPHPGGSWASSLIWGRNHETATGRNVNSYLAESVLPIQRKNFVTGRVELVDKDELFDGQPLIEQNLDILYGSTFRIGEYTIGYTRDVDIVPACRDRHRRQLHGLFAAGLHQAVLWRSARRRECVHPVPAAPELRR